MYVKKFFYGGFDWHDIVQYAEQLSEDGEYDVKDPIKLIMEDIIKAFPYINREKLYDAIMNGNSYKFAIKEEVIEQGVIQYKDCREMRTDDGKVIYENEGRIDGSKLKVYEEYAWGQFCYELTYIQENIDYEDVLYFVDEQFLCPTKGVPLVERFYHEPFTERSKAEGYLDQLQLHPDAGSRKDLFVLNREVMEQEWYKRNMEAIALMKEKRQSIYDPSFSIFVEHHIERLKEL